MILDGHVHIAETEGDREGFRSNLAETGVEGALITSLSPPTFYRDGPKLSPSDRMADLLFWCEGCEHCYPFFWIDPLADDAVGQVSMAVEQGARGFKVICDRFYPGDPRAMTVFGAIADAQRPILFHSGILWDGKPSSMYCRPVGFESLLDIRGLRFSLAHIGWPWCDEMIAVHGKFQNSLTLNPDMGVEMFIDTTPGTPDIYRRDALTRLFTAGYDVLDSVIFGSDSYAGDYNGSWVRKWVERDRHIMEDLGLDESVMDRVFGGNLQRFVGETSIERTIAPLRAGE